MQGAAPFAYTATPASGPLVTYNVLSWIPDGIEGRRGEWTTTEERLTVPSGAFGVRSPTRFPSPGLRAVYRCATRADHAALRGFLDPLLGRYTAFWCPPFQMDMRIVDASVLGNWTIRKIGYAARFAAEPTAKFVLGYSQLGALQVAVLVLGVVDNGDGTETITYSTTATFVAASSGSTSAALVAATAASFLTLARLDSDDIVETWHTPAIAEVKLGVVSILGNLL